MLSFNVIGLVTLPWQARWAGQRHEAAKLQAAERAAAGRRHAPRLRAVAAQQSVVYLRDARGGGRGRRRARAPHSPGRQLERAAAHARTAAAGRCRGVARARRAGRRGLARAALRGCRARRANAPPTPCPTTCRRYPMAAPELGDVQARALRDRLDGARRGAEHGRGRFAGPRARHARHQRDGARRGAQHHLRERRRPFARHAARLRARPAAAAVRLGPARTGCAEAQYMAVARAARGDVGVLAASEAREAWRGWNTAYGLARRYRDEMLPLRRQVNRRDGAALQRHARSSVWELLAETRASRLAGERRDRGAARFLAGRHRPVTGAHGQLARPRTALHTAAASDAPRGGRTPLSNTMNRRTFLRAGAVTAVAATSVSRVAMAALPEPVLADLPPRPRRWCPRTDAPTTPWSRSTAGPCPGA